MQQAVAGAGAAETGTETETIESSRQLPCATGHVAKDSIGSFFHTLTAEGDVVEHSSLQGVPLTWLPLDGGGCLILMQTPGAATGIRLICCGLCLN